MTAHLSVRIYQYCAETHLHRYLAEVDLRYNHRVKLGVNDVQRADSALREIVGERLTYKTIDSKLGQLSSDGSVLVS